MWFKFQFLSLSFLCLGMGILVCIPNGGNQENAYEIQERTIDSVWVKDTIQSGDTATAALYYTTGAKDCYELDSAKITKEGNVFLAVIKEKVYIQRICIQIAEVKTEILPLQISDPGIYRIVANAGTPDSIQKYFWVKAP